MPTAALGPKSLVAVTAVAGLGAAATYSRVVTPWQRTKMAEMGRPVGDLTVHVDRSGGGV